MSGFQGELKRIIQSVWSSISSVSLISLYSLLTRGSVPAQPALLNSSQSEVCAFTTAGFSPSTKLFLFNTQLMSSELASSAS